MSKMKKANKTLPDRINAKPNQKKLNPFEVHINKKKYDVIGKKSKTERGLPGISRSRAIKKRKATLLHEYTLKNKVNQFVDRRIGERDKAMTQDDKILARYTTERMRFHSRKSLYNLGDDEILTHRGESLAEIERFENPKSDDEDDDEEKALGGKLGESFVSEAHFGGGILKRADGENKNRKDMIDQMIADSKQRKAEKQKLREQTLEMTEKLDTAWRDILPLVAGKKARTEDAVPLKSDNKYLAYDKLSKELMFEARGKATDKLKSEAEIAQLEKKRLEELEKKRQERMLDDSSREKKVKHRSADDLDDGFDYNEKFKPKGKRKVQEDEATDEPIKQNQAEQHSSSEDEESDSSEAEDEAEVDLEVQACEAKVRPVDSEDEEEEDSDGSADTEDNLSDLKSSDSESEDETNEIPAKEKRNRMKINKNDLNVDISKLNKSLKNLPFTIKLPESYEEFEELCVGRDADYQAVVLERMIKTNHPSLPEGSRSKLVTLFGYTLQHLQDTASAIATKESSFKVLDQFAPWLYDLTQFATATTASMLSDVIKEKYEDFIKRPRRFPSLDTILFVKLIGILYPTSDYRHRLVTPTLLFMQHILASCRIQSSIDVALGLVYVTLILEFTAVSKRFTPEAINFLLSILRSTIPPGSPLTKSSFHKKSGFPLHVPNTYSYKKSAIPPLGVGDLISETNSHDFKLQATNLCLRLLDGFCENFDKSSEYLILEPFMSLLDSQNFHSSLTQPVQKVLDRIFVLKKKKLYKLMSEKKRPKPLKLYEPSIEDVYTFKKKRPMAKEKEEHDKLLYKYKKEVKGALREIRRDNSFISKLKYNETKASDLERQRKVKEIFGDAAQQAGDLNKLKRK